MIIEWTQIAGLSCVFMRMSGCILFNPILGRRNFPMLFQIGMTLMFSFMIMSYSDVQVAAETTFLLYAFLLIRELFIGFTIGIVVSIFMYVVIIAGEFIDMQMALSMSKIYDPQSGISMSVTATNLNLMFMFLFFGLNGHLTLIHLFMHSAEILPYGTVAFVNQDLSMRILDIFCQCTILGLKLAMPIAGILFLLQIGIGVLMKTVPQVNVFVLSLQMKIMTGLMMLFVIFTPIARYIEEVITLLFRTLGEILMIMGGV